MTEYEIYSYEAFKRNIHDELRTVERATKKNLSKDNTTEYLIKLRRQKQNLVNLDDNRILETQGICQDDIPTVAGLMLMGRITVNDLGKISADPTQQNSPITI